MYKIFFRDGNVGEYAFHREMEFSCRGEIDWNMFCMFPENTYRIDGDCIYVDIIGTKTFI